MSDYQLFLYERDKIDLLIQQGFQIISITENLNGAVLVWVNKANGLEKEDYETLQISTPIGRKYLASVLIKQRNKESYKQC